MNRKEFLTTCTFACFGGTAAFLQSCGSSLRYVDGAESGNKIQVSKTEFNDGNNSILVRVANSQFPLVVYRFSESEYSVLLLQCSHQGTELNVHGEILSCNAHGSEFDNKGNVLNGPAEESLMSFSVTTDSSNIYIHLE